MNKSITTVFSIIILMLATVFMSAAANAGNFGYTPGMDVIYLEINDFPVSDDEVVRINFDRDQELEINMKVLALLNLSDVEVSAYITGYKYNEDERLSDVEYFAEMESGVEYPIKLAVDLPQLIETDDYKLRVSISDRYSSIATFNFNLKVDAPENELKIKDIILNPADKVKAGRSLITNVRLKNIGQATEEDVRIQAEVRELGISDVVFMDELDEEETRTSDDLLLRIPMDTKPGMYTMRVTVEYDNDHEKTVEDVDFEVVEGDVPQTPVCVTCGNTNNDNTNTNNNNNNDNTNTDTTPAKDQVTINYDSNSKVITQGEGGAIYSITITNAGTTAKSFVIDASGVDWATVRMSPGNVAVVSPGESKAVYVYASANENAAVGTHEFTATIKSADKVVGTATFKADVVESSGSFDKTSFNSILMYLLIALVIVLVLVVVVLIVTKGKKNEPQEEEFDSTQSYY